MAKKTVVEIVCERCDRTEYIEPDQYNDDPDLVVKFGHQPSNKVQGPEVDVQFGDLCSSCTNTIRNLVAQISKKVSWKRNKADSAESES